MTCIYSATSWLLPSTAVGLQIMLRVCQSCDVYVSMLLHVQGAFFHCSAQISVLKRKTLFNQRGSLYIENFMEQNLGLAAHHFSFWYWKLGGTVKKSTLYLSQKLYVFFWDDFLLFCISFAPSIHCYWSLNQLLILGNQRGSQDEGLPLFSSIELWYKIHIILHRHRDCKTLRGRNWKRKKGGKSYQRSGGLTVFLRIFFLF